VSNSTWKSMQVDLQIIMMRLPCVEDFCREFLIVNGTILSYLNSREDKTQLRGRIRWKTSPWLLTRPRAADAMAQRVDDGCVGKASSSTSPLALVRGGNSPMGVPLIAWVMSRSTARQFSMLLLTANLGNSISNMSPASWQRSRRG
jgi:hypothetical protein